MFSSYSLHNFRKRSHNRKRKIKREHFLLIFSIIDIKFCSDIQIIILKGEYKPIVKIMHFAQLELEMYIGRPNYLKINIQTTSIIKVDYSFNTTIL